jgi:Pvc16 N-terminal domain
MIHEVDEALRRLVREEALRGSDIDVVFDAPTKDWAARRNAPTVNLYLYDLREDLRRRQRGLINEYDPTGTRVVARHQPPRHIKLSYLLTAWTQRAEDEHRLLSSLLTTFLRYEAVPPNLLAGRLAELGLPVPLTVALPPPEDRSFADVWSALGGELKPSLDIVVSAPVDAGAVRPAGPPTEAGLELALGGDEPVHHEVATDGGISARRGAW